MTVPINTPDAVPNQLIPASWGDSVRADLQRLAAQMVEKAGDSMTGMLILPSTNPTNNNHAVRLGYLTAQLSNYVKDNSEGNQSMQGSLTAPRMFVTDNPLPSGSSVVVNRKLLNDEVDALKALINLRVSIHGDNMSGDGPINMNGATVSGLRDPTNAQEAATLAWVNGRINTTVPLSGSRAMTGSLDMGNHQVTNVADPSGPQAAVTRSYMEEWVNNRIDAAIAAHLSAKH